MRRAIIDTKILLVGNRRRGHSRIIDGLSKEGYSVDRVTTGKAALTKIRRDNYGLWLIDAAIEDLYQPELAQTLQSHQHDKNVPLILFNVNGKRSVLFNQDNPQPAVDIISGEPELSHLKFKVKFLLQYRQQQNELIRLRALVNGAAQIQPTRSTLNRPPSNGGSSPDAEASPDASPDAEISAKASIKELMLLDQINRASLQDISFENLADTIVNAYMEFFETTSCRMYLYHKSSNKLVIYKQLIDRGLLKTVEKRLGVSVDNYVPQLRKRGYFYRALKTGEIFIIDDQHEIARSMAEYSDRNILLSFIPWVIKFLDIHSLAIIPIINNGEPLGLISLIPGKNALPFQPTSLKRLTNQIASIIAKNQAERRHKKSTEQLKDILDNVDQIIYNIQLTNINLKKNPASFHGLQLKKILGYPSNAFAKGIREWYDKIHPEDIDKVLHSTKEAIRNKTITTLSYRIKHGKSDQYIWLEDRIKTILDKHGRVKQVLGSARDISDKKEAELALDRSEEKYRDIFEQAYTGIILADIQTQRLINVNRKVSDIFGYDNKELLSMSPSEIEQQILVVPFRVILNKVQQSGSTSYECAVKNKHDLEVIFQANAKLVEVEGKSMLQVFVSDVTEAKNAEVELSYSYRELRALDGIHNASNSTRSWQELHTLLFRSFVNHFHAFSCHMYLYDHDTGQLILKNQRFDVQFPPEIQDELNINTSRDFRAYRECTASFESLTQGKIYVTHDKEEICQNIAGQLATKKLKTPIATVVDQYKLRSLSIIPLNDKDNMIGFIAVTLKNDVNDRLRISFERFGSSMAAILSKFSVQEALQKSEGMYRNMLEHAQVGMFRTSLDGKEFKTLNKKMAEYFNTSVAELLKTPVPDLWADKRAGKEMFRQLKRKGAILEDEIQAKTMTGETIDILVSMQRYENQGYVEGSMLDISQRKKAEEALIKSEQRNRALLTAMPDMMFRTTIDGTYLGYHVKNVSDLLISKENFIGEKMQNLLPDTIYEPELDLSKKAVKRNTMQYFEYEFKGRCYETRIVKSGPGEVLKIVRDITDRKEVEKNLKESERFLSSLIGNLPGTVYRCSFDKHRRLEYISEGFFELSGYKPAKFLIKDPSLSRIIHPDDLPVVNRQLKKAILEQNDFELEYRIITARNEIKQVWEKGIFVFGENRKLLALEGFITDVTERKRAEKKILELASVVENANLAILNVINSQITSWNKAAEKIFGYKASEIIGKPSSLLIPKGKRDEVADNLMQLSKGISISDQETTRLTKDGRIIHTRQNVFPIKDQNGKHKGISLIINDITEEKIATEALHKSEARYRNLVETINDGILHVNNQDVIQYVNAKLCQMSGYNRKDLMNSQAMQVFGISDADKKMIKKINRQRLTGSAHQYEVQVKTKKGEVKWWLISGSPMYEDKQRVKGSIAIITDITNRKIAEQQLEEQRKFTDTILNNIPADITVFNPDHRYIYLNPGAMPNKRLRKQFIGKDDQAYCRYRNIDEENMAFRKVQFHQAIKYRQATEWIDELTTRNNKKEYYLRKLFPYFEADKLKYMIGYGMNISELKKTQNTAKNLLMDVKKRMRELKCLYNFLQITSSIDIPSDHVIRQLVSIIPHAWSYPDITCVRINVDGSTTYSANYKKTRWNMVSNIVISGKKRGYVEVSYCMKTPLLDEGPFMKEERVLIDTLAKELGKYFENIYASQKLIDSYKERQKLIRNQNKMLEATVQKRTQALSTTNKQLKALLKETQKQSATLEARDHELHRQNEELHATLQQLQATQSQLVQSEKMASLGQLTAGIAHEINNPINFVYAGSNSLKMNFESLVKVIEKIDELKPGKCYEETFQQLEKIKEEQYFSEVMTMIPELINDIKMGAQRTIEIVKGLQNFSRLDEGERKNAQIHDGIESTLLLLKHLIKGRITIQKKYDKTIPMIRCYPGLLNQVFMNILSNAIQSLDDNGKIVITTRKTRNTIRISIKDNGKGMSEAVKAKIFDPFFTTKDVGEGTGLGLYISYGIIEKHDGNIEVKSKEGVGTEFVITLPRKNKSKTTKH